LSRILLAWELGANPGHLTRLAPIAVKLRAEGHQVLVAARDLKSATEVLGAKDFALAQAPLLRPHTGARATPASYAEILFLEGYADAASLWGVVHDWISIARLFRAEAIVADHSPGALIAGRILGLPQAQIGQGFEIPPQHSPMPSIRPWERIPEERLSSSEHRVTDLINGAIHSFRGPELEKLADLFNTEARIFTTFAELDPFGPRADERYVGPIYEEQSGDPVVWPDDERPRVYAYLRQSVRGAGEILRALKKTDATTVCFLPDAGPATVKDLTSESLRITPRPLRLDAVLSRVDLAVLYGGHGVVSAAMIAGVPLVVAPQTVEQYLHATRLEALGCGVTLGADRSAAGVTRKIHGALKDDQLKAKAQAFASRFEEYDCGQAVADSAAIIGGLVAPHVVPDPQRGVA
jgi:UDP:flavonoid glycosyltransferase YjiC (YdhE family)